MKKKKIIICIVITIFIVVIVILAYLKLNYYKTEKPMYELTQNLNNYNNLHVHTVQTSDKYGTIEIDRYWKDAEYKEKTSDSSENDCAYENSDEKIFIAVSEEDKEVYISENDEGSMSTVTDKSNKYTGIFCVDIDNMNQDYKYCGTENINNKECYKIFVSNKFQVDEATLWIEKETGFVLKLKEFFDGETITYENTYEIGTVTDDDIKKPDIQAYKDSGEYEFVYRKYKENGECEVTHIEPQGDTYSYIE